MTAAFRQILGVGALSWLHVASGAVFKEPLDFGCYGLDTFPTGADESTDVQAMWQWWPGASRARCAAAGGAVLLAEPLGVLVLLLLALGVSTLHPMPLVIGVVFGVCCWGLLWLSYGLVGAVR